MGSEMCIRDRSLECDLLLQVLFVLESLLLLPLPPDLLIHIGDRDLELEDDPSSRNLLLALADLVLFPVLFTRDLDLFSVAVSLLPALVGVAVETGATQSSLIKSLSAMSSDLDLISAVNMFITHHRKY